MTAILPTFPASRLALVAALLLGSFAAPSAAAQLRNDGRPAPEGGEVTGALLRWHPVTVTFWGPEAAESGEPNPFRDYRLTVTFVHEERGDRYAVPGYFAADGDAGETGATSGDRWRVHFTPPHTGLWRYEASFREGEDVALVLDPLAGRPAAFDGARGRFSVSESDKTGRDFRARGMLRYVGARYLRFDDGTWFLKGGADSPETLLAYEAFDGTAVHAGDVPLKTYAAHAGDWRPGDPAWRDGRGKGLVGALNYLASEGVNAISFLTMNVEGDGKNVWPWIAHDVQDRYDVSKLDQWERVFAHADSLGLHLHFKTQETENDQLLDGGELGPMRRLYCRELVARFGHHLALNWNLGEENDLWHELDDPRQHRLRAHIDYLRALDPYDHPVVVHSYPNQQVEVYVPLLGERSGLTGVSLQTHWSEVHRDTELWVRASQAAGKPWVVANDEQGDAGTGVKPDGPGSNRDEIRHRTLWGNLMAGGAGVEYYFGYQYAHNDLNAEDFRSRDGVWDDLRHALHFFQHYLPFWEMEAQDGLGTGGSYVFTKQGAIYAVYLPEGGEAMLNLGRDARSYTVDWYDPRTGGALQKGTLAAVRGGDDRPVSIGAPPASDGRDWVALVRAAGGVEETP